MQKSSYIEAVLVVAIISLVGYGTVVIRAMTEPNSMGDNQVEWNKSDENRMDWNQYNGDSVPLNNDPGVLGGRTSPDQGEGQGALDDGREEEPTIIGSFGGGVQEDGGSDYAGKSPDQPQRDGGSGPAEEPFFPLIDSNANVRPGMDEGMQGEENRVVGPTDSVGEDAQAGGFRESEENAAIPMDVERESEGEVDRGPAVDDGSSTTVSPRDQWFLDAIERLRGASPQAPADVTEDSFQGEGKTEEEFPGGMGVVGPSEEGDAPVEFGGTQSGDASGETGGDDIIRGEGAESGETDEEGEGVEEMASSGAEEEQGVFEGIGEAIREFLSTLLGF